MATRTVSTTGGNFNATGTWVGGVVPTTTDDIIGTSSSGPLTVTANATILKVDFTTYQNTLTINNTITLGISESDLTIPNGRNYFGAGMTISTPGTGNINFGNNQTIFNYGYKGLPNIQLTAGGKLFVGTFSCFNATNLNGNIRTTHAGLTGSELQVHGTFSIAAGAGWSGVGTTRLVGTGSITGGNFTAHRNASQISQLQLQNFIIDTPGTYTFPTGTGYLYYRPTTGINTANNNFTILSGNFVTPRIMVESVAGNPSPTEINLDIRVPLPNLELISPLNFDTSNVGSRLSIFNLKNDLNVDEMLLTPLGPGFFTLDTNVVSSRGYETMPFVIRGTYSMTIGTMSHGYKRGMSFLVDNKTTHTTTQILLNPATHSISKLYLYNDGQSQTLYGRPLISGSPSVATINLGNTSSIMGVDITDINFTGQNLYSVFGTLTNTNAVNVPIPPATGGGESSYTFVN
jgi:hypothetical protein